jgi:hypothetical protein
MLIAEQDLGEVFSPGHRFRERHLGLAANAVP